MGFRGPLLHEPAHHHGYPRSAGRAGCCGLWWPGVMECGSGVARGCWGAVRENLGALPPPRPPLQMHRRCTSAGARGYHLLQSSHPLRQRAAMRLYRDARARACPWRQRHLARSRLRTSRLFPGLPAAALTRTTPASTSQAVFVPSCLPSHHVTCLPSSPTRAACQHPPSPPSQRGVRHRTPPPHRNLHTLNLHTPFSPHPPAHSGHAAIPTSWT